MAENSRLMGCGHVTNVSEEGKSRRWKGRGGGGGNQTSGVLLRGRC